jgi:site-specific DNA-methyltransferase (adenine-specific)
MNAPLVLPEDRDVIIEADNLAVLPRLADGTFTLIYIDPPFGTGRARQHTRTTATADPGSPRAGFGGRGYRLDPVSVAAYPDAAQDYMGFIAPRLAQARRLLSSEGTLYLHLDYREAHRCKLLLDEIFGPECFLNEIIWAYDYGGRSRRRWAAKHDTILVYVKDPEGYFFDQEAVDRIPYMAPGLQTEERARRGKLPTDVWWHTIVPTRGAERTGYPTQKPTGIIRRIIQASSRPGDRVLDFFAGSGTTGAAARELDRRFLLIDENPEAVAIMQDRLAGPALEVRRP